MTDERVEQIRKLVERLHEFAFGAVIPNLCRACGEKPDEHPKEMLADLLARLDGARREKYVPTPPADLLV